MQLKPGALSLSAGILWAAALLLVGVANLASGSYGAAFLEMLASIYPGYHASGGLGDLAVGTLYGLVDGIVGGLLFAWLYNALSKTK